MSWQGYEKTMVRFAEKLGWTVTRNSAGEVLRISRPADERFAEVTTNASKEAMERYLPDNYRVVRKLDGGWLIAGKDVAGWTLEGYVLPRLASGMHWAKEVV